MSLHAELPEGNLRFLEKAVDVGFVPAAVPQSLTVQVRARATMLHTAGW